MWDYGDIQYILEAMNSLYELFQSRIVENAEETDAYDLLWLVRIEGFLNGVFDLMRLHMVTIQLREDDMRMIVRGIIDRSGIALYKKYLPAEKCEKLMAIFEKYK